MRLFPKSLGHVALSLSQSVHKRLAAHACGVFVEAEGVEFEKRLGTVLPVTEKEIQPSNFEEVSFFITGDVCKNEKGKAEEMAQINRLIE